MPWAEHAMLRQTSDAHSGAHEPCARAARREILVDDNEDVYYPKVRRPREDEEGEESYEKQRQRPYR